MSKMYKIEFCIFFARFFGTLNYKLPFIFDSFLEKNSEYICRKFEKSQLANRVYKQQIFDSISHLLQLILKCLRSVFSLTYITFYDCYRSFQIK